MALKSYRLKVKKKEGKKFKPVKGLLAGGITALLGVALLAQTASVIKRI